MTAIADKMRARAEVFRSCAGDLDVEIARLTRSRDMLLDYARLFESTASKDAALSIPQFWPPQGQRT